MAGARKRDDRIPFPKTEDLSKGARFRRVLFLIVDAWSLSNTFLRTRRHSGRKPSFASVHALTLPSAGYGTVRTAHDHSGESSRFRERTERHASTSTCHSDRHEAPHILLVSTFPSRQAARHSGQIPRKRWRTMRFTTHLPASASRAKSGN